MTLIRSLMIAAAGAVFSFQAMAPAHADFFGDRWVRSQEIRANAARGGPQPQGSTSPMLTRIQVCKNLPYTKIDRRTGRTVTGTRQSCWFE